VRGDFDGLLAISDSGVDVIDEIEPVEKEENDYREASRKLVGFLFGIFDFILGASNATTNTYRPPSGFRSSTAFAGTRSASSAASAPGTAPVTTASPESIPTKSNATPAKACWTSGFNGSLNAKYRQIDKS
jgi:hypothetical protein